MFSRTFTLGSLAELSWCEITLLLVLICEYIETGAFWSAWQRSRLQICQRRPSERSNKSPLPMFNQTSFCLAVAHWGLHSLRPETLNEVIKGLFSSSLRLLFPSIWTCLEWALNFQVTETKDWGIPPQNETNGCVLFALAVNVSAPLMGCTGTEITGGQRAVRTQGSGPVTWTGHTPPALPAHQLKADHGGPGSNSALCYSGLMVLDDKKCAFFLMFFGLFVFL